MRVGRHVTKQVEPTQPTESVNRAIQGCHAMHVSPPMTDDQSLMRFFTHDKLLRILDPKPVFDAWSFLDKPREGKSVRIPRPEYGSLWMSLPHTFRDKEEGTFPALNKSDESFCDCAAQHLGLSPEEAEEKKRRFLDSNPPELRAAIRARTRLCGVSCWYQDSTESLAMWDEYVPDGRGAIIITTLKQFEDAIGYVTPNLYSRKARPRFSTIDYIDRDQFFLAQDGYYELLGIKSRGGNDRKGYEHEREVRLIAKSPSLVQATDDASPSLREIEDIEENSPPGFNLLIDLKRLIVEIRVHPDAGSSYIAEITEAIAASGLPAEAVRLSSFNRDERGLRLAPAKPTNNLGNPLSARSPILFNEVVDRQGLPGRTEEFVNIEVSVSDEPIEVDWKLLDGRGKRDLRNYAKDGQYEAVAGTAKIAWKSDDKRAACVADHEVSEKRKERWAVMIASMERMRGGEFPQFAHAYLDPSLTGLEGLMVIDGTRRMLAYLEMGLREMPIVVFRALHADRQDEVAAQ